MVPCVQELLVCRGLDAVPDEHVGLVLVLTTVGYTALQGVGVGKGSSGEKVGVCVGGLWGLGEGGGSRRECVNVSVRGAGKGDNCACS